MNATIANTQHHHRLDAITSHMANRDDVSRRFRRSYSSNDARAKHAHDKKVATRTVNEESGGVNEQNVDRGTARRREERQGARVCVMKRRRGEQDVQLLKIRQISQLTRNFPR